MIKTVVGFLILTLAAAGKNTQEPDYNSNISEVTYSISATNESSTPTESETKKDSPENSTNQKNENETPGLKSFFNEVRICRKNYPNLWNITFRMNLYCFLLTTKEETSRENPQTDFYCNFTGKHVDELKDKLHVMPFFREISELNEKSNFCGNLSSSQSPKEEPVGKIIPNKNFLMVEDNLKLKLGDEWIYSEPKFPYTSHIYLGTSKFPILTEESRIIEKTTPHKPPPSTQRAYIMRTTYNQKERKVKSNTTEFSNIYSLLKPFRWEKNLTHMRRSTRTLSLHLTTPETDSESVEKTDPQNIYDLNPVINSDGEESPQWKSGAVGNSSFNTTELSNSTKQKNFIQKGVEFFQSTFSKIFKKPKNQ